MELRGLRGARHERFLTQQELADRAGMTRVSVQRLEALRTKARPTTVRRLADALDCAPETLLGRTDGEQGR